jgi:hypothetical protein
LLEQIFSLRPLDCKDSARAFPKREVREKPPVILGTFLKLLVCQVLFFYGEEKISLFLGIVSNRSLP